MMRGFLLAPLLVVLAACGGNPQQGVAGGGGAVTSSSPGGGGPASGPGAVPVTQHRSGVALVDAQSSPMSPPADWRSAKGASEVVRYYYRLVQVNDLNRAQAMWGDPIAHEDNADFVARFAGDALKADVGEAYDSEGAAGSIYITVPVTISGYVKAYPEQKFSEKRIFTLKRVNDVPGASAAQLRWHIVSIRDAASPEGSDTLAY